MTTGDITGTFTSADLDRLLWPIAWSGTVDRCTRERYERALYDLVTEARETLVEQDAVAVEIERGVVVGVVVEVPQ